jgi:hypothetical protein
MPNENKKSNFEPMSSKNDIIKTLKAVILTLGVIVIIKHILEKTETRLFSKDAVDYLNDDKKLAEIEKHIGR